MAFTSHYSTNHSTGGVIIGDHCLNFLGNFWLLVDPPAKASVEATIMAQGTLPKPVVSFGF